MELANKPKGVFSASRIVDLCPVDQTKTKTAQSYCLDLALEIIGIEKDLETAAMRHGAVNQHNAFELVVKPLYPNALWHDDYIPINDVCGASPDVLIDGIPLDIKCPYTPMSFFEHVAKIARPYAYQLNMQMWACNSSRAIICYYCTRPETFAMEEWREYDIPLDSRFRLFEVSVDEAIVDEMNAAIEKYLPVRNQIVEMLKSATVISDEQFFFDSEIGVKYRHLKDATTITNLKEAYRLHNEFLYIAR
jgi:hypothetical protein